MRKIDVCLTPDLLHLFDLSGKIAIVVDILRATSSMVTAFAHQVLEIRPVAHLSECDEWIAKGYLGAGERDGIKVEGFEMGNSPMDFMNKPHQRIVMTTTNGTKAIKMAEKADEILIGAFLNINILSQYLQNSNKDVVIVCAGWKGNFNMEDSIFAGALVKSLESSHLHDSDAALAVMYLYAQAQKNIPEFLQNASHFKRLNQKNVREDVAFCLQMNLYEVIPMMQGDVLIQM